MRATKKPVTIEAVRVPHPSDGEREEMMGHGKVWGFFYQHKFNDFVVAEDKGYDIKTLEGTMHASPGDYIIRGVKGEFYPCKPDIFAETYDVEPEKPGTKTIRYGDVEGRRNTFHGTAALDVEVDTGGQVVAVWFRCLPLPFKQSIAKGSRADEMRDMYRKGSKIQILNVEVTDPNSHA